MARNQGHDVTNHVMGSAAPLMSAAMTNPGGTVGLFLLFSLACVALALVQGLVATAASWGPYALLCLAGGTIYACHRWLWTPLAEDARTPRRITGAILLSLLAVFELCTGRIGVAMGAVTGLNPEAVLMDAGLPVTGGIRSAVLDRRSYEQEAPRCSALASSGDLVAGTSASVDRVEACSRHLLGYQIRDACLKLGSGKGAVSQGNIAFCDAQGITVPRR